MIVKTYKFYSCKAYRGHNMVYITDEIIDKIIKEDVPYSDITTEMLGISNEKGAISFYTRSEGVIAGAGLAGKIFTKLGCEILSEVKDGEKLSAGSLILQAKGNAAALHTGWKVSLNTLEYLSGIATLCREMVDTAHSVNQNIVLAATRKSMPLSRQFVTLAFQAGGVSAHRLGLSETVLIFKQHLEFISGLDSLEKVIKSSNHKMVEKKIILETENMQDSLKALHYDFIDGLQLDKLSPDEIKSIVNERNSINPKMLILAAGGINKGNIKEYAEAMPDVIVSSAFFHAKPLDIKAVIEKNK